MLLDSSLAPTTTLLSPLDCESCSLASGLYLEGKKRRGFHAFVSPNAGGYKFEGWQLERRRRLVIDPAGTSVKLSKGEYALLVAFLEAPQRPLTREYILKATRINEDIFDRSVDIQVLRLRRKLEPDPSARKMILTERGIGYLFAFDVERY